MPHGENSSGSESVAKRVVLLSALVSGVSVLAFSMSCMYVAGFQEGAKRRNYLALSAD
jgi:hypothetical protein